MFSIYKCVLPDQALLNRYRRPGTYTDCYVTDIFQTVTHVEFLDAFYNSWIFKLERMILKWVVSRPSTDAEAKQLAQGTIDSYAAWTVEDRCENQILLSDFRGRTKSWLMVAPQTPTKSNTSKPQTQLYFGSAVLPVHSSKTKASTLGSVFQVLIGFHKVYSRVLLYSAKYRLQKHR